LKNANGYGGITKLPGNRRNPYRVRVTVGWDKDPNTGKSRQIYKTVGYYPTQEAAIEALAMYHKNPTITEKVTFSEVYAQWSASKFSKISHSNMNNYKTAYSACESLYNMRFADIRLAHLQAVIDTCGKNYPSLTKIKILFNQLYDYAMQHDLCNKDYSSFVNIAQYNTDDGEEKHKIFTTEEIQTLWANADRSADIRVILILICAGLRVGELLDLKKEAVDLHQRIIRVKKAKTKSGVRIVPIADCVFPFWQELMEQDGTFLIPNRRDKNRRMMYASYLKTYFTNALEQVGIGEHFPHDSRYTFVSVLTSAGIAPVVIKRIVGHKSKDITERVYTHFELQQLREAVNTPDWRDPFIGTVSVL
jgi:integrase